jgi:hypothetical protein
MNLFLKLILLAEKCGRAAMALKKLPISS